MSTSPRRPDSLLRRSSRPQVELLESRNLPSALTPIQVRHAYGFDQITGDGSGQTIAIIDAYNAPNIYSDLNTFDQTFSLTSGGPTLSQKYGASTAFLTKATPQGGPRNDVGWSEEISLDVEWAHAIAPGAKILLVEARTSSLSNLLGAVDYAVNHGAAVVSMSWGSGEFSSETNYDSHFAHSGVTFVASAGDSGSVTEWPAVSPNVVAVGGTSLSVDAAGNYLGEKAWSGSGGGISSAEAKPTYQGSVTLSATQRTSPDVAYDADPNTGVAVYDSYFAGGWGQYGGTSAGAPQWAGLFAIANQLRVTAGKGTLDGRTQTLPDLYAMPASNFHDVATGSSGSFAAGPGYDAVTGRGSPIANLVVAALAGTGTSPTAVKPPASGTVTPVVPTVIARQGLSPAASSAASGLSASVLQALAAATPPPVVLSTSAVAPTVPATPVTPLVVAPSAAPVAPSAVILESGLPTPPDAAPDASPDSSDTDDAADTPILVPVRAALLPAASPGAAEEPAPLVETASADAAPLAGVEENGIVVNSAATFGAVCLLLAGYRIREGAEEPRVPARKPERR